MLNLMLVNSVKIMKYIIQILKNNALIFQNNCLILILLIDFSTL